MTLSEYIQQTYKVIGDPNINPIAFCFTTWSNHSPLVGEELQFEGRTYICEYVLDVTDDEEYE